MRRFRAPPIEWISERVPGLQDVLEARTGRSALILRELLGPIQLKPAPVDVGRPYYRAVTSIDALALIETPPAGEPAEGGSNSLQRWTLWDDSRTRTSSAFWVPCFGNRPTAAIVCRELSADIRPLICQAPTTESRPGGGLFRLEGGDGSGVDFTQGLDQGSRGRAGRALLRGAPSRSPCLRGSAATLPLEPRIHEG